GRDGDGGGGGKAGGSRGRALRLGAVHTHMAALRAIPLDRRESAGDSVGARAGETGRSGRRRRSNRPGNSQAKGPCGTRHSGKQASGAAGSVTAVSPKG